MTRACIFSLLLACWGCASTAPSPSANASCACGPQTPSSACHCPPAESLAAYAVTRPAIYNDFPVSYRVSIPRDRDGRILPVDQPLIRSQVGSSEVLPCCP